MSLASATKCQATHRLILICAHGKCNNSIRYIKDERTIILAVVAANQDMTTSDGLKLAMDIDRDGKRTIGCITKAIHFSRLGLTPSCSFSAGPIPNLG